MRILQKHLFILLSNIFLVAKATLEIEAVVTESVSQQSKRQY